MCTASSYAHFSYTYSPHHTLITATVLQVASWKRCDILEIEVDRSPEQTSGACAIHYSLKCSICGEFNADNRNCFTDYIEPIDLSWETGMTRENYSIQVKLWDLGMNCSWEVNPCWSFHNTRQWDRIAEALRRNG